MGLFDRLFGKKEEPKIEEEVVKEALENLDLSEDTEAEEVSQEEAEIAEEAVLEERKSKTQLKRVWIQSQL